MVIKKILYYRYMYVSLMFFWFLIGFLKWFILRFRGIEYDLL